MKIEVDVLDELIGIIEKQNDLISSMATELAMYRNNEEEETKHGMVGNDGGNSSGPSDNL